MSTAIAYGYYWIDLNLSELQIHNPNINAFVYPPTGCKFKVSCTISVGIQTEAKTPNFQWCVIITLTFDWFINCSTIT